MREVVIFGISHRFRRLSQSEGQIAHVLLTRSPLVYPRRSLTARLACVKHAASVRPEPGSNSPLNSHDTHPKGWTSILDVVPARDRIADKNCRNHRFLPKEPSTQQTTPKRATRHADGLKQTNSSTFDTLLSSQGSSAHRNSAFRPRRGATW